MRFYHYLALFLIFCCDLVNTSSESLAIEVDGEVISANRISLLERRVDDLERQIRVLSAGASSKCTSDISSASTTLSPSSSSSSFPLEGDNVSPRLHRLFKKHFNEKHVYSHLDNNSGQVSMFFMQLQRTSGFRCKDASSGPSTICPRPLDPLVRVDRSGSLFISLGTLESRTAVTSLVSDISSAVYLPGSNLFIGSGASYISPGIAFLASNGTLVLFDILVCSFGVNLIGWVNCSALEEIEVDEGEEGTIAYKPLFMRLTLRSPPIVMPNTDEVRVVAAHTFVPVGTSQARGSKLVVGTSTGSVFVLSSNGTILGQPMVDSIEMKKSGTSNTTSNSVTAITIIDVAVAIAFSSGQIKVFSIDEELMRKTHVFTLSLEDPEDESKKVKEEGKSMHPIITALAISSSPWSLSGCYVWGANGNDLFLFKLRGTDHSSSSSLASSSFPITIKRPVKRYNGFVSDLVNLTNDKDLTETSKTAALSSLVSLSSPSLAATRSCLVVSVSGAIAILNASDSGDVIFSSRVDVAVGSSGGGGGGVSSSDDDTTRRIFASKSSSLLESLATVAILQRPAMTRATSLHLLKVRERSAADSMIPLQLPLVAIYTGKYGGVRLFESSLPSLLSSNTHVESIIEDPNSVIGWVFGILRSPVFLILVFAASFYLSRSGVTSITDLSELGLLVFSGIVNRSPISKVMSGMHSTSQLGIARKALSQSRASSSLGDAQGDLNRDRSLDFNDRGENVAARSAQLKSAMLKAQQMGGGGKGDNSSDDEDMEEEEEELNYQRKMLQRHVEALKRREWGGGYNNEKKEEEEVGEDTVDDDDDVIVDEEDGEDVD